MVKTERCPKCAHGQLFLTDLEFPRLVYCTNCNYEAPFAQALADTRKSKDKRLKRRLARLILGMMVFSAAAVLFLLYGPYPGMRDLYVTTAMTTFNHQFLAKALYSEQQIQDIMARNKVIEPPVNSAPAAIPPASERPDNIELIDIVKPEFRGYLLKVSNPARVAVGTCADLGQSGMKLPEIIQRYHAVAGINGGAFADPEGKGSGGVPGGIVIENGQIRYQEQGVQAFSVIGFDRNNVLVLGTYTLSEIQALGIRDAVSFRPFLIVNGVPAIIEGNGGWGIAPRTAIGQTKDGTVLMLVIDGRQRGSIGASLKDVQEIMLEYGAYNAANLDGGASSTLFYAGKIVNRPSSIFGDRTMPSAFIVKQQA